MKRPDDVARVAVFGSSVTALVTGARDLGATHLTYPAALDRAGFDVANYSRIYGLISDCKAIWAYPLAQTRPDVVLLQYGLGETFPRVFPKWLNLSLLGVARRSGPVRDAWWRLARRLLMSMHRVERVIDARLPLWWSRMSFRRFERELDAVCERVQHQIGCRLVLMTAYAASAPTPFLTAAMTGRLAHVNDAIRRVAAKRGADVFDLAGIVDGRVLPDGLHMDVETHELVAQHLADLLGGRSGVRAA